MQDACPTLLLGASFLTQRLIPCSRRPSCAVHCSSCLGLKQIASRSIGFILGRDRGGEEGQEQEGPQRSVVPTRRFGLLLMALVSMSYRVMVLAMFTCSPRSLHHRGCRRSSLNDAYFEGYPVVFIPGMPFLKQKPGIGHSLAVITNAVVVFLIVEPGEKRKEKKSKGPSMDRTVFHGFRRLQGDCSPKSTKSANVPPLGHVGSVKGRRRDVIYKELEGRDV